MRIELDGLKKVFDNGNTVLSSLTFSDTVRSLAIIGPSGGGKSTLLRLIGGLMLPSAGKILLNDILVPNSERDLHIYRRNLGFVFQNNGLFKHLSAFDNIVLPLVKVHGYSESDAKARANELLERLGLLEHSAKRPVNLSGGQQQRVAIARAISARPKVLLLDEPTSALDPEYTAEVLELVGELSAEGLDFIIVTHEMGFAMRACEKVAFLYGGSLVEYGNSEEIFKNPSSPELKAFLSRLLEWDIK